MGLGALLHRLQPPPRRLPPQSAALLFARVEMQSGRSPPPPPPPLFRAIFCFALSRPINVAGSRRRRRSLFFRDMRHLLSLICPSSAHLSSTCPLSRQAAAAHSFGRNGQQEKVTREPAEGTSQEQVHSTLNRSHMLLWLVPGKRPDVQSEGGYPDTTKAITSALIIFVWPPCVERRV